RRRGERRNWDESLSSRTRFHRVGAVPGGTDGLARQGSRGIAGPIATGGWRTPVRTSRPGRHYAAKRRSHGGVRRRTEEEWGLARGAERKHGRHQAVPGRRGLGDGARVRNRESVARLRRNIAE